MFITTVHHRESPFPQTPKTLGNVRCMTRQENGKNDVIFIMTSSSPVSIRRRPPAYVKAFIFTSGSYVRLFGIVFDEHFY